MAKAIGPILQIVGAFLGPWGIIVSYIGAQLTKRQAEIEARKRARAAYNSSLQDRTIVMRSAISPRRWALGRTRIGGTYAYFDAIGDRKEKLDQVVVLCNGPIKGVAGMWLNDQFIEADDFDSGAPTTGQFSPGGRKAYTAHFSFNLTASDTFTLGHVPRSAADVKVSLDLGPDNGYETVAVESVAGNVVTLVDPVTGWISGSYWYQPGSAPYQVQWLLGGRYQPASSWIEVASPKWTAAHRLQGIANSRSLCDWDESIFAQGKPAENWLVDGVVIHDPRYNLNPVYALTGAVVGNPGTLPTNVGTSGIINGLAREITAVGDEDGVPFFEIRIFGTTTASGQVQLRLPVFAACPAAASGEAWNARCHMRVMAGTLSQFTSSNISLTMYDAGGVGTNEAAATLNATIAAYPLRDAVASVSDASAGASTTKVGSMLRFNYASGAAIDITLRVGLPQLWRTEDPTRWSSNPGLLAGWWLTLPRREGGMGVPFSWVDWPTVVAAANICDETISVKQLDGTGYEDIKRYECNTTLSTDAAPLDNFAIILGSMAGRYAFTAGVYRVYAGAHRTPTLTITDRDVDKDSPLRLLPDASSFDAPPNVMNGRIVDAARGYVETGVTPVENALYIEADGGEEPDELDLYATTDGRQAQYLMGVELERRRPRQAAELTVTGIGADIALGRVVQLDLDGYEDFDAITWEVVGRGNRFNGKYPLQLEQIRSSDWALDPDKFTPVDQPLPPDNSYLWDVAELVDFHADSAAPTRLPDGTTVLRMSCAWDEHSQAYVLQSGKIDIRWRRVDVEAWSGPVTVDGDETQAEVSLGGGDKARYLVQARARNGLGAMSEWVEDIVDVSADTLIDGIDLVLGTRAIVLPADTSGNVTSYSGASSTVKVFRNQVDETGSWTLSRTNSSGVSSTLSSGTLTITALTAVTDAGYVDVTATRSGYPTQTQRLSIGKARAGADGSSAFTATATANMSWSGGVATKISGGGTWNGSVRSDQAYPGGAGCAFVADQATAKLKIALNSDPATDNNYTSLDFAIFLDSDGSLSVYESGTYTSHGTYAAGDVFAIIYNGESVIYYHNGSPVKTTSVATGLLLYLDSSFRDLGSVSNLTFYPQAAKGDAAKLLQITATSQVFQVSKAGGASPSSITFTANSQNLTGSPSFSVIAGTATLTGSGSSRSLTYANLTTDTATIQVTQDGLTDAITVAKIREGADAVTSLLSNEAVVLPADAAGHVTSYSGAVTSMSVFKGATDDTANWSFSRTNGTGVTSTLASNVLTITALADANDSSYVDITATRSGHPTQVKRVKLSKSKQGVDGGDGNDGADAPLLTLSATSQIFTFDGNNAASPTSQTITLTAVLANLTGTAGYTCTRYDSTGTSIGTVTLGGTGNARTLTVAQFGAAAYANITATLSGRSDTVTVVRVRDGTNSVVSDLTNDSHTLPADASGNVTSYAGAETRMVVFIGTTDDSLNWTYSAAASTGVTAGLGSGANENLLTVTAMTAGVDSGYVDITATKSGQTAQVKRFTIGKSKAGTPGGNGADAPLLTLSATSQIFTFDGNNSATPTSQTITLTAVLANLSGTATFTCTRYDSSGTSIGTVTLGGSGNARTLTVAQFAAAAYANITASLSGRSDTVTVVRVRDGTNSAVSDLTNDSHTLPADSSGNVTSYAGAQTRMVVYLGTVDDSANWSYSAAAVAGVTAALGAGADKNLLTVTAMSNTVEAGHVDITATKSGHSPQTKRFGLAKSRSAEGTSGFIHGHQVNASHLNLSGTALATIRIKTDGRLQVRLGTGAFIDRSSWFSPPTTGIGTGKHLRVQKISSFGSPTNETGTYNTWQAMTADRDYSIEMSIVNAAGCDLLLQWSDDGGTTIFGSGRGSLYVERA